MISLFELVKNNQALNQLSLYFEYGINTNMQQILLPYLKSFQIDNEVLTKEDVQEVSQQLIKDMSIHNCSRRDIGEMANIVSVYGQTAVYVQSLHVPKNEIDPGWAASFFDCAKSISNPELQSLWSKILVQELNQPNTFFKRTLDVFHSADKFEIDWFFEISKFVFDKACVPEFILTNSKFYQFNKFQTLIDAGFVNASLGSLSYPKDETIHLVSADIIIEILKPPFILSIYTLTDAGNQIFDLNCEATTDEYIAKLKEVIEINNRAKVVSVERK